MISSDGGGGEDVKRQRTAAERKGVAPPTGRQEGEAEEVEKLN